MEEATILYLCQTGNLDGIQKLIKRGANFDIRNNGSTPLHVASQYGQEKIIDELINAGLNPNALDQYGNTALHIATQYGRLEVVKILVPHTNLDIKNNKGELACQTGTGNGTTQCKDYIVNYFISLESPSITKKAL
jgi:ankyrin repeat protein